MWPSVVRARWHGWRIAALAVLACAVTPEIFAQPVEGLGLVCLDSDGFARDLSPLVSATPKGEVWQEISTLAGPDGGARACWAWSDACPPVKLASGSDLTLACGSEGATPALASRPGLLVRSLDFGDESAEMPPLRVTAAPSAMWREVPRGLLPAWSGEAGAVRVPQGTGPWRVQACRGARCSRWTDISQAVGEVSLRLSPTRAVSHEITAGAGPLENARFYLVRPGRTGFSQTEILGFEQTDVEGRVRFQLPIDGESAVVVSSEGYEAVAFLALGDVPDRVELEPGFHLRGRIVNGDGEPVVARLFGRSFIRDGFGLTQLQKGRSGADGRFLLHGFPSGSATLRAVAELDGALEIARRLELEGSLDLGDIVLSEVEVVWVQVVDALRLSPVNGALIRAADGRETRTGTNGSSRVQVRLGRELQVTARGYGFSAPRLPAGVGRGPDEPFVIELEPALTVTGVFLAADGLTTAVSGRFSARGADDLLLSGPVGADGAFSVDLPGGGAWELELTAGNAGSVLREVAGSAGETIDLGIVRAAPSAVVSGYLVDENYEGLAEASVTSTPPSEAGPLLAPLLGGSLTAVSGPDGYFELHGLQAGPASLRLAAEGYAPRWLETYVEGLERVDLGQIELARGRQITVRSDIERGLVELGIGGAATREKMTMALDQWRAVFRTVPEGPLTVVVLNGDGQPVCTRRVVESEGDLAIRCNDRSVQVTGRVTMGGVPAAGRLHWRRRSIEADLPGGFFRSRTGGLERVDSVSSGLRDLAAALDAEGNYRLDFVLPGEWDVLWVPGTGGAQEPQLVEVPARAGGPVVRDIVYGGVSVQGAVFDPEGRPAGRATVEAFPGQTPVVTDSRGNFRMLGLRPGSYEVRARRRGLRSDLVGVDLTRPGDRASVQLHLAEERVSDRLRIEVRNGSGGFCYVETDNASGGELVQVRGGMAEAALHPPLGDLVRAACSVDGRWVFGEWRSIRQVLKRGLTFDPSASTASLALIGRNPAGSVTISAPGGWDLGRLRMWFGGAPAFSVGETIPNLPVGAYLVRRGGESRTVLTERRRVTEVDLDS